MMKYFIKTANRKLLKRSTTHDEKETRNQSNKVQNNLTSKTKVENIKMFANFVHFWTNLGFKQTR